MQIGSSLAIVRRVDLIEQGFGVAGLQEVVEGAEPYDRHGRVDRGVPAENDHFGRVALLAKGLKDFDAVTTSCLSKDSLRALNSFRSRNVQFSASSRKWRNCAEAHYGKPHKRSRRLTPKLRKRAIYGRKLLHTHHRARGVEDHELSGGAENQFADLRPAAHTDDNLIDSVFLGKLHQVFTRA